MFKNILAFKRSIYKLNIKSLCETFLRMLRMDGLTSDFGLDMWVDTKHYLGQLVNPKGLPYPTCWQKTDPAESAIKFFPKDFERTELCSESVNPE